VPQHESFASGAQQVVCASNVQQLPATVSTAVKSIGDVRPTGDVRLTGAVTTGGARRAAGWRNIQVTSPGLNRSIKNEQVAFGALEMIRRRQPGLPAADDQRVVWFHAHPPLH
jgi:hypothetical protein